MFLNIILQAPNVKISVRIIIGIAFIFRLHRRPFQLVVFVPVAILILSSHLHLDISKGLFPVYVPVQILKALLFSILTTWPAHLNLLDLIILTILGERYKL
jgi:hypothetical protein